MKKTLTLLLGLLLYWNLYAPPNCELYKEHAACYRACNEAMMAIRFEQGSYQSQQYFDQSIASYPDFAYSYMEKGVPFLKRGLFVEWKKLIDKAVELSPEEYLGYRAWCRFQFLRDYEGYIADIEQLKSLVNYDIGHCQTGDYHLNIVLAICYKEIGDYDKARALFLEQLNSKNYSVGSYDYYHLGVLEYQTGQYEKAIAYLDQQIEMNDYLAETYYFKALAYKKLNQLDLYAQQLAKAEDYYRKGNFRIDTYVEMPDKIYLLDILDEKDVLESNERPNQSIPD